MTYTQAVTIRTLQLQGVDIGDKLLNEAIAVIKNTRTPTAWPTYGEPIVGPQTETRATCDLCPHAVRDYLTKNGKAA